MKGGEVPYKDKIVRSIHCRSVTAADGHFIANALGRIIDRAIQVHGALAYSREGDRGSAAVAMVRSDRSVGSVGSVRSTLSRIAHRPALL